MIRPTARAEEQWARMVGCGLAVRARATQRLDEAELKTLRDTLKIMCENMHALVKGRVAPLPAKAELTNGAAAR